MFFLRWLIFFPPSKKFPSHQGIFFEGREGGREAEEEGGKEGRRERRKEGEKVSENRGTSDKLKSR